MKLIDFKKYLEANKLPRDFTIIETKENSFLAEQYLKKIETLASNINKTSSIFDSQTNFINLFSSGEDTINIVKVDNFNEYAENYSDFTNTIVFCETVDKAIHKQVTDYIIKLPKFEAWQLFDYMKKQCSGLADDELYWLLEATKKDAFLITNELDKISIFAEKDQKAIFYELQKFVIENFYNFDLFKIVNALLEGDLVVLSELVLYKNYELVDPVVITNRALMSAKNILVVTQNPTLTAEACGVSQAQCRMLRYKYRNLNAEALRQKIKFLADIDYKLKTSRLDLNRQAFISYLIANLAYKITL